MDISSLLNTRSSATGGTEASRRAQENQDRFLTLLVAQMRNQDPMNPMENAQLTTQIAQIQTVTGVDQLNTNIEKLGQQFNQGQLAGAVGLVGRHVTTPGNRLSMGETEAYGFFELAGAANNVQIEIVTPAGTVIDTVDLGAASAGVDLGAASAGRHAFSWTAEGYSANQALQFRVKATRGATAVASTSLSRDQVVAVNTRDGQLQLELAGGRRTDFSSIVSVD